MVVFSQGCSWEVLMFRIPVNRKPTKAVAQHRIGVVGASRGCGVSFVCGSLALAAAGFPEMSKDRSSGAGCTLAEFGTPYFFNALNAERRFAGSDFVFYEDAVAARKSLFTVRNIYRRVNLLLRSPDAEGFPPEICVCKMPGEIAVFDFSGADPAGSETVLAEMDRIIIVIDPMPTALLSGRKRIEELRMLYPDASIVVNKMNKGVHKAELRRFLGTDRFLELPYYAPELMYRAEYNCIFPSELKECGASDVLLKAL